MKKILLGSVLFSCVSVMNAQYSGKVGIKTDKPSQTLDVNGTMRIGEIGKATDDGKLIFWNKDTKQLVSEPTNVSNEKKIFYITYAIHLSKLGQDYADGVPLGINSNKYTAALTQAYLVRTESGAGKGASYYYDYNGAKQSLAPYVEAPLVYKSNGAPQEISFSDGYLKKRGTNQNVSEAGYLAIPQKDTYVKEDGGNYFFYGDYRDVTLFDQNTNYTWVITLLVINKDWVDIKN